MQDLYNTYGAPREEWYSDPSEKYWFVAQKKINWRDFLVNGSLAPSSHAQARDPNHVRLDKEEGWRAVADFLVALEKQCGDDPRLGMISIGEYYTNPDGGGIPSDLDEHAFKRNIVNVWADMDANAPLDASGDRVNIVQSQPQFTRGYVTPSDLATYDIGISGSGLQIFEVGCGQSDADPTCNTNSVQWGRQQLEGQVPLDHQGDTNWLGQNVTWTGISNPWGYTKGQVVPLRLEHAAWYFSTGGPVPSNSFTMRASPQTEAQWFGAFDQFGPNGSLAAQWGQIANYP